MPDVHADQMDGFFASLTTERELNMPTLADHEPVFEFAKSGPGTRSAVVLPLALRDQRVFAAAVARAGATTPIKEAA